jgi:hypothetical protein
MNRCWNVDHISRFLLPSASAPHGAGLQPVADHLQILTSLRVNPNGLLEEYAVPATWLSLPSDFTIYDIQAEMRIETCY